MKTYKAQFWPGLESILTERAKKSAGPHWDEEMAAKVRDHARVMQAAPELLAALQELCADKYLADPINADRMSNARAAIARAKGGAA